MNSSPYMDNGKPLSASMNLTMAHKVLPTGLDAPICYGVLVAANSWMISVSK